MSSPNYMDLSEVSIPNYTAKQRSPGGANSTPLALAQPSSAVDDANGPSELESNIQSIVDTLKN